MNSVQISTNFLKSVQISTAQKIQYNESKISTVLPKSVRLATLAITTSVHKREFDLLFGMKIGTQYLRAVFPIGGT